MGLAREEALSPELAFHLAIGITWASIAYLAAQRDGRAYAVKAALVAFVVFTGLSAGSTLLPLSDCTEYTPQGASSC